MKQVLPDITQVLTSRYIANLSRLRRFVRYWGTTTVDGIEVFTDRKHFYPDMDESTTKLTKMLGVYDKVKVEQEGIRSAWLFLNPEKAEDSEVDWDNTIIAANFNKAMTTELSCSVIIGPRMRKLKQVPADITTPVSNQAGIIAEIKAEYQTLWNNNHAFFSSEEDPYLAVLTMLILRSTDVPYTVVVVEETVSSSYLPSAENMDGVSKSDQVKAWRVRLTIPPFVFTPTTDVVTMLSAALESSSVIANLQLKERIYTSSVLATPADGSDEGKPDTVYTGMPMTLSSYWHTHTETVGLNSSTTRYLKTSILTASGLNTSQKFSYITSCIDTGFRKKKRKWYETLITLIIIIGAVFLAGPQGGAAASAVIGVGAAFTTILVIAMTITIASLYVALAALAASYMGAQNIATALGQFLKTISPLTQIASVVALVTSVYGAIRRSAEQAAKAALEKGVQSTLMDTAAALAQTTIEAATGLTKLANMTMLHIIKMLNFTFDIYKDMKNRDLQRELNNYRTEIASLSGSKEKSETSDIVKELMASYPNPLSNDWSFYSEIYDRPYEWWSTPYHTGNIQATTVNALWLNDPQNAIIYNNSTGDS